MAGFSALSNELLDLVPLSPVHLSRLSQTSKTMHHAFLPRLYKRVSLHWEALKPAPPILSLLRTILSSPDIATMVEELHLSAKRYGTSIKAPEREANVHRFPDKKSKYSSEDKPSVGPLDSETEGLVLEALHSMQLLDTKDMPKHDLLDFVIFVLSARCNNLKVLHLDLEFLHRNTFLPRVLSQLLNVKQKGLSNAHEALTRLVKVQLDTTTLSWALWRKIDFPFSSYIPFLYLPSLETFSAPFSDHRNTRWSHLRDQSPREWPTSTPPVSILRKLDLCHAFIDPTALTFLLAELPHLEILKYDLHRNCVLLLDCIELRHALVSVSRTLRELTISYDVLVTEAYEVADNPMNHQGIGSLRFLSRLTRLEIALPLLLGWRDTARLRLVDALPGSLEEFCLRDDCTDYVHNMWWGKLLSKKCGIGWKKGQRKTVHLI